MKWLSTFKKPLSEHSSTLISESNELAKHVRSIEIRARRLVGNLLQGQYHSIFRGTGIEFDELRAYIPGDDIRTIDWKSWARTGQPLVRRYREERDLTVLIAVDISSSLNFGSTVMSKNKLVAELCAVFALSAIRNTDRVGVVLFSGVPQRFIPASTGSIHLLRIIREVLSAEPEREGTDIAAALKYCTSVYKRKGTLFVISDFLDSNYERELRVAAKRFDIIAICVREPLDRFLPSLGVLCLENAESSEVFEVDTNSASSKKSYLQAVQSLDNDRTKLFKELGIYEIKVVPGLDYLPELLKFFQNFRDSV